MSHKSCSYCFDAAEYYCGRCFASYCCRDCQVKDWQIHKEDCIRLPALVPIKAKSSEIAASAKHEVLDSEDIPMLTKTFKASDKQVVPPTHEETALYTAILSRLSSPGLTAPPRLSTSFFLRDLPFVELPSTPLVALIATGASDFKNKLITVRDATNTEAYEKLCKQVDASVAAFKIIAKTQRGFAPQIGELCMAFNHADEEWYRAVCYFEEPSTADSDGRKYFSIYLIDYGTCDTLPMEDLMPIRKELLFPTCIHTCKILNLDMWNVQCKIFRNPVFQCRIYRNKISNLYELLIV